MHLQKFEEYVGGSSIGADRDENLFKGVVFFMITELKSNTPYLIKTCPEKEITGEWLKDELVSSLQFSVRGIVCVTFLHTKPVTFLHTKKIAQIPFRSNN